MSFTKFKNAFRSYKRLLETDTLGSFDFFTCIICLDSIDSRAFDEFMEARRSRNYLSLSRVMPLVVHEFTHFIDSTSTVWGMNHLKKMKDAYCSNSNKGGTEDNFYRAKYFLEHVRSLRFPNYYTLVDKSKKPIRPWSSRITIGKQFCLDGTVSNNPILFSSFENSSGEFLARSPLSTVSLLEASAMSNEMVARIGLIKRLDEGAQIVENSIYEREALSYIYNQNITEYSVCVHILANHLHCKDLFIAFQVCSIVTRLVLNFPRSLISKVLESAEVYNILNIPSGHEFEHRMKAGIRSQNLGVLYYLICCALPKDSADKESKIIPGIEAALSKLGVSLKLMSAEASKEVEEISQEIDGCKINVIGSLSRSGVDNFNKIPFVSKSLEFQNLSLPPIYLGDGAEARVFGNETNVLKNIGIEEIFNELYEGQEWVERFSEACTV